MRKTVPSLKVTTCFRCAVEVAVLRQQQVRRRIRAIVNLRKGKQNRQGSVGRDAKNFKWHHSFLRREWSHRDCRPPPGSEDSVGAAPLAPAKLTSVVRLPAFGPVAVSLKTVPEPSVPYRSVPYRNPSLASNNRESGSAPSVPPPLTAEGIKQRKTSISRHLEYRA